MKKKVTVTIMRGYGLGETEQQRSVYLGVNPVTGAVQLKLTASEKEFVKKTSEGFKSTPPMSTLKDGLRITTLGMSRDAFELLIKLYIENHTESLIFDFKRK